MALMLGAVADCKAASLIPSSVRPHLESLWGQWAGDQVCFSKAAGFALSDYAEYGSGGSKQVLLPTSPAVMLRAKLATLKETASLISSVPEVIAVTSSHHHNYLRIGGVGPGGCGRTNSVPVCYVARSLPVLISECSKMERLGLTRGPSACKACALLHSMKDLYRIFSAFIISCLNWLTALTRWSWVKSVFH